MMKISSPKIKSCIEGDLLDSIKYGDFNNKLYSNNIDGSVVVSDVTFDSCIFEDIDFNNIKLDNVDLVDVIFRNCDLSNQIFDNKLLCRVIFDNCKILGTSFVSSSFKDVLFDRCNGRYVNLFGSKICNVRMIDSDFGYGIFTESSIKNMELCRNVFMKSEFIKTNLNGIDFSDCDIEGIVFDIDSLKGIEISALQASDIVMLFGVCIK